MIGIRAKPAIGMGIGPAIGAGADPFGSGGASNPMAGVTRDATSGIYCPASAAEWTIALAAAGIGSGNPSFLWLMQDASGGVADSIGSATMTATGVQAYQQAVSGWSRLAVTYADASAAEQKRTAAPIPNSNAFSTLILAYQFVTGSPAATRQCLLTGNAISNSIGCTTTGHYQTTSGSTAVGTASPFNGAVRPVAIKHDLTNLADAGYTDADKLVPTYRALSGLGTFLFGATTTPPGGTLYAVQFIGAAAELSDANVKKLLQTLGWTISWS